MFSLGGIHLFEAFTVGLTATLTLVGMIFTLHRSTLASPLKKSFGRDLALSVQSRPRQNSETRQVDCVLARTI